MARRRLAEDLKVARQKERREMESVALEWDRAISGDGRKPEEERWN